MHLYVTALGIMVLTVYGFLPVSSVLMYKECDPGKDIQVIQTKCKHYNELQLQAETEKNYTAFCKYLIEVYKCVATNVTWCLDYYMNITIVYFHSPMFCQLTSEATVELQEIKNSILKSYRQTTTTPPPPMTTFRRGDESTEPIEETATGDEEEGGVEDRTVETNVDNQGNQHAGNQEKHKGSNSDNNNTANATLWNTGLTTLLLLVSVSLTWTLTS